MVCIRRLVYALLIAALASIAPIRSAVSATTAASEVLPVLCWHDIRDAAELQRTGESDPTTVATRDLVAQFEMLRVLGFTPISLSQWQAARAGQATLPAKPVLLSFDDGFKSLYTRVFPLLKLYGYPAVASIVSEWMEADGATANGLVSWAELREMSASGLVEIASHTHAMHNGVIANPQGNELPASVSRIYADGTYESDAQYQARLFSDLDSSKRVIQEHLGAPVRTLVWPYGEYSETATSVARRVGFSIALGLSPGVNTHTTPMMQIKRTQVLRHNTLADLLRALQSRPQPYAATLGTLRTLSISLDDVYHPVAELQEMRLANLLETVRRLGVNTVIVRAWSEVAAADGTRQLYFPNASLPMRADLLSRATWQLRHRSEVQAWVEWPAQQSAGFEELGKHVSMSGLVLQIPAGALGDSSHHWADDERMLEIARSWRPDLVTALAVQIDTDRASALRMMNRKVQPDFLIVRGSQADLVASARPLAGVDDLTLADGQRRERDRLILESVAVPADIHKSEPMQPVRRGADHPLDALLASGARHIGYQSLATSDLAAQLESLWPRLSTATLRRPRQ